MKRLMYVSRLVMKTLIGLFMILIVLAVMEII
jgi:hypothetical protein